jgi:pilus assembly protein CpaE
LSYPPEKLIVVLNRANQEGGLRTKDIETALHHELFAQIPDDGANMLRSINRGIPLVVRYPRSPASQAIRHLAKTLISLSAPEAAVEPVKAKAAKPAKQPKPATKQKATAS